MNHLESLAGGLLNFAVSLKALVLLCYNLESGISIQLTKIVKVQSGGICNRMLPRTS